VHLKTRQIAIFMGSLRKIRTLMQNFEVSFADDVHIAYDV
jgi:hypothetical protein